MPYTKRNKEGVSFEEWLCTAGLARYYDPWPRDSTDQTWTPRSTRRGG